MFCKHCGKEIDNDSAFCKHCGSSLLSTSSIKDTYISRLLSSNKVVLIVYAIWILLNSIVWVLANGSFPVSYSNGLKIRDYFVLCNCKWSQTASSYIVSNDINFIWDAYNLPEFMLFAMILPIILCFIVRLYKSIANKRTICDVNWEKYHGCTAKLVNRKKIVAWVLSFFFMVCSICILNYAIVTYIPQIKNFEKEYVSFNSDDIISWKLKDFLSSRSNRDTIHIANHYILPTPITENFISSYHGKGTHTITKFIVDKGKGKIPQRRDFDNDVAFSFAQTAYYFDNRKTIYQHLAYSWCLRTYDISSHINDLEMSELQYANEIIALVIKDFTSDQQKLPLFNKNNTNVSILYQQENGNEISSTFYIKNKHLYILDVSCKSGVSSKISKEKQQMFSLFDYSSITRPFDTLICFGVFLLIISLFMYIYGMTMLIKIVAKTNVKLISLYIVISSIITILTLTNDYYILYNGYKGLYLIGNWDQFLNFSHLIFVVLLTIPIVYFLTKSLQEKKHGLEQYPKAHKKKYYISVIRNSPKELFRRTCMGKVDRNHYFVALAIGCVALIVIIIISIVLIASIQVSMPTSAIKKTLQSVLAIMPIIALIQVIKMGIRRLRDAGKSSYYMLLLFVPIVGWIILTIMHCLPSQVDEENDFNKT